MTRFGTGCLIFALGVAAGAAGYSRYGEAGASRGHSVRENHEYRFINPLLACEFTDMKDARYDGLENKAEAYIKDALLSGKASKIGFYMRGITGGWTGVNETDSFAPASLYKVPELITYLKLAESSPAILDEVIVFSSPATSGKQDITPRKRLVAGESYSINELLRRMIVYSDNDAALFLLGHISQSNFDRVFSDLGLPPPSTTDVAKNAITPKQYAFFLRILYNASYLSRPLSEKALSLLSEADFQDGIAAGLPSGTTVAHKFGEFIGGASSADKFVELHDCGFVYMPEHPYSICIMTRGKDIDDLEKAIADISRMAYETQASF